MSTSREKSHKKSLSRRQFLRGTAVSASALALAACVPPGSGNAPDATGGDAPSRASTEVVHWDWWVTQGPWVDGEIELFQEANPGVTVEKVTHASESFDDLLSLAFRDGSAPDVFMSQIALQELVNNNWLLSYNNFSDYANFEARFPNPELDFVAGRNVLDGETYTAPFTARSEWWNQIYVNTKILEEAGYVDNSGAARIPATLDEFLEACRTVVDSSGGEIYGYGNPLSTGWTPGMWLFTSQLSGGWFGGLDYRTNRHIYGQEPSYQTVLEALAVMRDEGLILPESFSIDDEGIRALFAQHRFAFLAGGVWVINGWQQTHPEFTEYTMMAPPLVNVDQPQSYFYTQPGQSGAPFMINSDTEAPDAAWAWVQWLYSPEAGRRWVEMGNGTSIHPENNSADLVSNDAMKIYFDRINEVNRVGPSVAVRNPNSAEVLMPPVQPDENAIIQGIASNQIRDIAGALEQLARDKDAAFDQALQDAQNAGVDIAFEDYLFPDWVPTEDYVTRPNS